MWNIIKHSENSFTDNEKCLVVARGRVLWFQVKEMKRIKSYKLLGIYICHGTVISCVRKMFKNIVMT